MNHYNNDTDHFTEKQQAYRNRIESLLPHIPIRTFRSISEQGLHNDIIVLNEELVIRFAKNEESQLLMQNEYRIIRFIRNNTDIPVPDMQQLDYEVVAYPYLHGVPLFRHKLMQFSDNKQTNIISQLGNYMNQMHSLPIHKIKDVGIGISPASSEDFEDIYQHLVKGYEKIKEVLYPHMKAYTQSCVDASFSGIENGPEWFKFQPCLIHADIGLEHILVDESYDHIVGIIDFGNAGTGCPYFDLGILLDNLGEHLMSKMADSYPYLHSFLAKARVGLSSAAWHIRGLETGDIFWHLVHLMTAKDIEYK